MDGHMAAFDAWKKIKISEMNVIFTLTSNETLKIGWPNEKGEKAYTPQGQLSDAYPTVEDWQCEFRRATTTHYATQATP